jgi:SAM-dependent methyltransferase
MFARAVVNSIDRLLERAPGRDIFAVDAGCGPYAFLALVAALRSPQVKVLALEGNPRSVALASNVAESLGLADRVLILEEDARTFEAACPIDLLMTETFDAGLVEEHGSSILKNLRSQVALSGISIPSHVQVDAELINIEIHPGRFALRVALREPAFSSGVEETLEAEFSASDLERGIYQLVLKTSYDLAPDVPQITMGSQCAISVPQQVAVFEILNPVERLRLCLRPGKISISIESTPSENIKVLSDLSCYRPRRRE